jgi:hypothetical protein
LLAGAFAAGAFPGVVGFFAGAGVCAIAPIEKIVHAHARNAILEV